MRLQFSISCAHPNATPRGELKAFLGPGVEKKADNAFEKTDVHLGALEKVTLQMSKSDKGLRGRKMGLHTGC